MFTNPIDLMTLFLFIVAVIGAFILAVAARGVIKTHREFVRRRKMTPEQRAWEDLSVAFSGMAAAFVKLFTPVVYEVTNSIEAFAEAMAKVDIKQQRAIESSRADVPHESE